MIALLWVLQPRSPAGLKETPPNPSSPSLTAFHLLAAISTPASFSKANTSRISGSVKSSLKQLLDGILLYLPMAGLATKSLFSG